MNDPPRVLFRSDDWLVLDKPSGIATVPPAPAGLGTLLGFARDLCPRASHHHPLSRLDVEVSGAVAFALSPRSVAAAARGRDEGSYLRVYVALLAAAPTLSAGRWSAPVGIDPRDPRGRVTSGGRDAKNAVTEYVTLALSPEGVARVECRPRTGRTHQIRVHARSAGCPVLGDARYGGPKRVVRSSGAVVGASRVMLHLARVELRGSLAAVECAWPEAMELCWRALGGT